MNLVDIVLLLLLVASIVHGVRLGAAIQVMSFGGFWLGLFLGALLAPRIANSVSGSVAKATVSLVVVFGLAAILGGIGRVFGVRLWRVLRRAHLAPADAGLGAIIAFIATLVASWLVASILVSAPAPQLSSEIRGSAILGAVDGVLPPAPSVFARIQRLINTEGFPTVFAQLPPATSGPVTLPTAPALRAATLAAGGSTVKIEGVGCGQIQEGTGFVVAPNLVVTNAHVVAGILSPKVFDRVGSHRSEPILFDPSFDLAVLRTTGLNDPTLRLLDTNVGRGTQGAVMGYPGGGSFDVEPAGVMQEFDATGRDIYGQGLTTRPVYELQSVVRPGNSGGPLVEPDGTVVGVVFSRSASDPNIGYALASPGVVSRVHQAQVTNSPSGTGSCAG
ncbi:MAG TPA: MarP family serine protease [Acidimicrobiales bacterium]|nr:MarP family serine protease [Acidimicrobiales bacterium]